MSTQTTFVTGVTNRIKDAESKLTQAELLECLADALNDYSHQRPRAVVSDLVGDGTAFVALPADWEADFSRVVRLDRLDADEHPELVASAEYDLIENPTPEGQVLYFLYEQPAADDAFRLKYTARHAVTAAASTVPSADEHAVMDLAASYALLRMAAAYAQSENPALGTVQLDYKSKADTYKGLAADYQTRFEAAMSAPAKTAAGGRKTWTPTTGKIFH